MNKCGLCNNVCIYDTIRCYDCQVMHEEDLLFAQQEGIDKYHSKKYNRSDKKDLTKKKI